MTKHIPFDADAHRARVAQDYKDARRRRYTHPTVIAAFYGFILTCNLLSGTHWFGVASLTFIYIALFVWVIRTTQSAYRRAVENVLRAQTM